MSQEMEFKNIVAQYSKVDLRPWILCLFWVSSRIPLILNWMKTK